jgi:predicted GNAT family acetyltransferase
VITVEDRPELGRYQLCLDGEVAGYSAYELHGTHVAFMHTQIEERFAGHGLGVRLVAQALDGIRQKGGTILPYCPFVRSFIASHRAYADLVPRDQRAAFGLADRPSGRGGEER